MKQGRLVKNIRTFEIVNIQTLVNIEEFKEYKSDMKNSFKRMTAKPEEFGMIMLSTKNSNGDNLMLYAKVSNMLKITDELKILLKNKSMLSDALKTGDYNFWWDTEKDFVLFTGEENDERIFRVFKDIKCF